MKKSYYVSAFLVWLPVSVTAWAQKVFGIQYENQAAAISKIPAMTGTVPNDHTPTTLIETPGGLSVAGVIWSEAIRFFKTR